MDMGGTDSGSSTSDSSSGMMTMLSYLHFTGGDNLFFKSWQPLSRGAIAGACIGLVALALLDRFLAGVRGGLESYWSKRLATFRICFRHQLTFAQSVANDFRKPVE